MKASQTICLFIFIQRYGMIKMFIILLQIGLYLLMFDVIFKVGEKVFENKYARRFSVIVIFQILVGFFLFIWEYAASFYQQGHFGTLLGLVNTFCKVLFNRQLNVTPSITVLVSLLDIILMYGILYYFRIWILRLFHKYNRLNWIRYDEETHEFTIVPVTETRKITQMRIGDEVIKFIFFFVTANLMELYLSLFYFWIYQGKLEEFFFILFLMLLISIVFLFVAFFIVMKDFVQYSSIQAIFFDILRYEHVIEIFEECLKTGSSYLMTANYDIQVKEFLDLGIFQTVEKVDLKDIATLQKVSVQITDKHLSLYYQESVRYLKTMEENKQV